MARTFVRLDATALLLPPFVAMPHVTTVPLDFSAANAYLFAVIETTFVNLESTLLLSPPTVGSPQVTTVPSFFRAANAYSEGTIFLTVVSEELTAVKLVFIRGKLPQL